jgi:predicted O-methyltransferase YrrM
MNLGANTARRTQMITSEPTIIQQLLSDQPSFHLGGDAVWYSLPQTLEAIRAAVRPGARTLETGAGASTVIFAAGGADHTAISPDAREHELIRDYCRRIGVDAGKVTFIEGLSDDVLPPLLGRERTLDVAFIDGAHSFPFPEVDWHYITRAMKIGGKLLMDDIPIPAVAPLFRHMKLEPNWRADGILDDRAAAFTLLAPPAPEDWPDQPFNRGYPDFRSADPSQRLRLETAHRLGQLRSEAARRYPALHRLYRRAAAELTGR